jgi:protein SCO1/2
MLYSGFITSKTVFFSKPTLAALIIIFPLIALSCGRTSDTQPQLSSNTSVKTYHLRGKVVALDTAKQTATIDHEAIPGFMEAMTMDFPIKDKLAWDVIKPGATIDAELAVDNTADPPFWLQNVVIQTGSDQSQPALDYVPEQVGKAVPPFRLTNQDSKKVSLSDYKGKALAVTFIYSKCPLPSFCIRMSQNFADLANQLAADEKLKNRIRLLSISFDPENDTPEKLRQYGIGYLGRQPVDNLTIWNLATASPDEMQKIADFFGLKYEKDQNDTAQFNHNLVTAVISPEGKVTKVFSGNRWTIDELKSELEKTLTDRAEK